MSQNSSMERTDNIRAIAEAYGWLNEEPANFAGYSTGKAYSVRVGADTDPRTTFAPQGIHFGYETNFDQDGNVTYQTSVKLVNHDDPNSFHDYLPIKLYGDDKGEVDVKEMNRSFSDERLARMALNAAQLVEQLRTPRNE